MAQKRTLGENPLDLIVPKQAGKAKKKRKVRRAKASPKKARSRSVKAVEEEPAPKPDAAASAPMTEKPREVARQAARVEPAATKRGKAAHRPTEEPAEQPAARKRIGARPGQYLTFLLGGEEYGAAILQVKEIIEYDTLTSVPTTPPWIRGVINLRGSVVPVIDLAVKFGLPETAITSRTCIVIVEAVLDGDAADMGVMVDSVSQVIELSGEGIEPAPAFGTRIHVEYLLGMGRLGEKFVLLLDVDRVLSSDELMTASAASAGASTAEETVGPGEEQPVTP